MNKQKKHTSQLLTGSIFNLVLLFNFKAKQGLWAVFNKNTLVKRFIIFEL